jgi:hypothetical protein
VPRTIVAVARLIAEGGSVDGQVFSVDQGLTIGREGHNDICLEGSRHASRDHAKVWKDGARSWAVADLGSTNGTLLNDAPVTRHALAEGDVIRIGDVHFRFELEDEDKPKPKMPSAEAAADGPPDLGAILRGEVKPRPAREGATVGGATAEGLHVKQRVLQYSKKKAGGSHLGYDLGQMAGGTKWLLVLLALALAVGVFLVVKNVTEKSRAPTETVLPE